MENKDYEAYKGSEPFIAGTGKSYINKEYFEKLEREKEKEDL